MYVIYLSEIRWNCLLLYGHERGTTQREREGAEQSREPRADREWVGSRELPMCLNEG